ncbi:MAG: hypothetical protein WBC44_16725 [Planctomycetaceae bacterium]
MTEPPTTCDEALVELLAALELSLLQYVSQAELWTDAGQDEAAATLGRLAKEQRQSSAETAERLAARHLLPELTNFPSAFAQLHYLALTYMLDRLIANQQSVVAVAEEAVVACDSIPVLKRIRDRETRNLIELQRLRDLRSPEPDRRG